MKSEPLVILWVLILGTLFLNPGCTEEDEPGLIGTYQRIQYEGTESYIIQIQFSEAGQLVWTPIDSFPGHTASSVNYELLLNDQFRIYNDSDCGNEGTYAFTASTDGVYIEMIQDDCTPRQKALTGHWGRK